MGDVVVEFGEVGGLRIGRGGHFLSRSEQRSRGFDRVIGVMRQFRVDRKKLVQRSKLCGIAFIGPATGRSNRHYQTE